MEVGSDCENSVINTPEQMSARGLVNSFNQTAGRHIRFRLLRRWKPACKKTSRLLYNDFESGLVLQTGCPLYHLKREL